MVKYIHTTVNKNKKRIL